MTIRRRYTVRLERLAKGESANPVLPVEAVHAHDTVHLGTSMSQRL